MRFVLLKNRKHKLFALVIIAVIILLSKCWYSNISKSIVFTQEGRVPIEFIVKYNELSSIKLSEDNCETLFERYQTSIYLKDVIYRDNDVYFTFYLDTDFSLSHGDFLSVNEILENDRIRYAGNVASIQLQDFQGEPIEVNETSSRSFNEFSFSIHNTELSSIEEGFSISIEAAYLYSYTK